MDASAKRPGSERARKLVPLAVSTLVAVVLVGVTVWSLEQDGETVPPEDEPGTPTPAAAPCDPVRSEPVEESRHIDAHPLQYSAPPASGNHSSRWAVLSPPFYGVADRPKVSVLVHNLEHGYNILWYDETVAGDAEELDLVMSIARSYGSLERDPAKAFIAAPWTAEDGEAMPAGMHYALTHWYADPQDRTRSRDDEVGYTMYCRAISADVVRRWMRDHPLRDAPEGYRVNM